MHGPGQHARPCHRRRRHHGHDQRRRVDIRRAVLHQRLRRLPAGPTPASRISYAAVGSSAGITRFTAGQADFGATDVPASAADLAGAHGGPAVQVPVDLGAVSVAYNVLRLNGATLRLTGPVLARIFLGQITHWNDPAIIALNPSAGLPDVYINVVHRSDGSGTTYIFSDYLSRVSPAWAATVGTGRSLHWPVGYAADGNSGVAAAIDHTPYSIGYVERSYTTGTNLGSAAIQNQAGNYVTPTSTAIAADAAGKPAVTPGDFSIVNQPGPAAYPICGYSWALISARQPSQADRPGPGRTHQLAHPRRTGLRRRPRLRPAAPRRPAPRRRHPRPRHRPRRAATHRMTRRQPVPAATMLPARKRLKWRAWLDLPVGLSPQETASGPPSTSTWASATQAPTLTAPSPAGWS